MISNTFSTAEVRHDFNAFLQLSAGLSIVMPQTAGKGAVFILLVATHTRLHKEKS